MNQISDIYPRLKPSIVAIASRLSTNPDFPDIIGTGFIARSDGIIITNEHVIKAIKKLPRRKSAPFDEWPAVVLYFHLIPGRGMLPIPFVIKGVMLFKRETPFEGSWYGPEVPDVGMIHVHVKDLQSLQIASRLTLKEGDGIMLSGFPMGTDTLRAPGWLHQLSPTLQSGIISAILPFPCENPHALLLDVMTQGGSSGSPVFNPDTGEVIGLEYAGLSEPKVLKGKSGILIYENNTSLTLAIPPSILFELYRKMDEVGEIKNVDVSTFDTIETLIAKKEIKVQPPKAPTTLLQPVDPDDIIEGRTR